PCSGKSESGSESTPASRARAGGRRSATPARVRACARGWTARVRARSQRLSTAARARRVTARTFRASPIPDSPVAPAAAVQPRNQGARIPARRGPAAAARAASLPDLRVRCVRPARLRVRAVARRSRENGRMFRSGSYFLLFPGGFRLGRLNILNHPEAGEFVRAQFVEVTIARLARFDRRQVARAHADAAREIRLCD